MESSSTFPPYKGIILEESRKVAKAFPLVLKYENTIGVYGRVQRVSDQVNWTNNMLGGLQINSTKTREQQEQLDSIQLSLNFVNINQTNIKYYVSVLEGFVREKKIKNR